MLKSKFILSVLTGTMLLGPVTVRGQDNNALLDLLVRKKIITTQEAQEVRAELTQEAAAKASSSSGDKWKLSTPITELELYGDTRLRYEYRGGETASTTSQPHDWLERSRERYRLRIGLRGILADDWFFGVRLETSQNPRSTNVTFGDDTSTSSGTSTTINGPFAKNSDGINVGQAYLGYKGFPDLTLTAGKMPNPIITTLMVWDADINPEGAAEQWKHTFTFNLSGGGGQALQSLSKDGKSVVEGAGSEPLKLKIDLFANFAQFVYDDANPENPLGPRKTSNGNLNPNTDAWLLAWQVGAKFTFPKNLYVQVAPVLYNYTGSGDTFNSPFVGGSPNLSNSDSLATNQTGIDHLLVLEVPAEFGFRLAGLPMRIFTDFAVNFEADERATAAGFPGKGDQRYAYLAGLGIGQLKATNDWELRVWWQHTDQYSLDPNLVDSDIWDSRVNMEGIAVSAGYMLSNAVTFNLTYAYGWPSDKSLGTGGNGDIGINPLNRYQLFQADLNVKF